MKEKIVQRLKYGNMKLLVIKNLNKLLFQKGFSQRAIYAIIGIEIIQLFFSPKPKAPVVD
jgi:hypothetical protein